MTGLGLMAFLILAYSEIDGWCCNLMCVATPFIGPMETSQNSHSPDTLSLAAVHLNQACSSKCFPYNTMTLISSTVDCGRNSKYQKMLTIIISGWWAWHLVSKSCNGTHISKWKANSIRFRTLTCAVHGRKWSFWRLSWSCCCHPWQPSRLWWWSQRTLKWRSPIYISCKTSVLPVIMCHHSVHVNIRIDLQWLVMSGQHKSLHWEIYENN